MKIYNIYFSPTGGTKKVADMLGSAWREEKQEIDLSVFGKDYTCLLYTSQDHGCLGE